MEEEIDTLEDKFCTSCGEEMPPDIGDVCTHCQEEDENEKVNEY